MIKILQGNALHLPVKDKSVHCIVTSSPYFNLRAYVGQQEVDWPAGKYSPCTGAPACIEVPAMRCGFGAESTVEAYIFHSLLILRECRRVLRDDGVMWYNLGDSFSSQGGDLSNPRKINTGNARANASMKNGIRNGYDNLVPGNLIGIPARLMLAAQADGWIIRNDCIWKKCSAMPESISGSHWVKHRIKIEGGNRGREKSRIGALPDRPQQDHDGKNFKPSTKYIDCPGCDECTPNGGLILKRGSFRHTRAHEFVFMLTKQMQYFSNPYLIKERISSHSVIENAALNSKSLHFFDNGRFQAKPSVWSQTPSCLSHPSIFEIAILLTRSAFDSIEFNKNLSLPSFYFKIRDELLCCFDSYTISDLPSVYSLIGACTEFLFVDTSTEHFISQLNSLGLNLRQDYILRKERTECLSADCSSVYCDTETSVGIKSTRDITQFVDSVHNQQYTKSYRNSQQANPRSVLTVDTEQEIAAMVEAYEFELRAALADNRNPNDVLSPRPSSYSGQHFAVFSPDLIRSLIKSSTPKKCCQKCGAGYAPVIKTEKTKRGDCFGKKNVDNYDHGQAGSEYFENKSSILGYRPTCECNAGAPVPGICLDPFVGSGTTLSVCRELGVNGIGIDISFPYLWEQATHRAEKRVPQEIQKKRIAELPLFCQS